MSNGDSRELRDDPSGTDITSSIFQMGTEAWGGRGDLLGSTAQGIRDASEAKYITEAGKAF